MKSIDRYYYIGDHIRSFREGKGWTQQALGKRLGKKTSTISSYETNAKLPSTDCLIKMAELFDTSLDTLVYGENAELLAIHSLSQDQKELVSAIVQYFSTETEKRKTADQRIYLIKELVRLLTQ